MKKIVKQLWNSLSAKVLAEYYRTDDTVRNTTDAVAGFPVYMKLKSTHDSIEYSSNLIVIILSSILPSYRLGLGLEHLY